VPVSVSGKRPRLPNRYRARSRCRTRLFSFCPTSLKIDNEYEYEDGSRQLAVSVCLILERQSGHASLIGVEAKTEEHVTFSARRAPLTLALTLTL
jgi:hypothetical protein